MIMNQEDRLKKRVKEYKETIALVLWSLENEVSTSEQALKRTKDWTDRDRQHALQDCINVLRLPSSRSRKPMEERRAGWPILPKGGTE
jgi:hypothetical protein